MAISIDSDSVVALINRSTITNCTYNGTNLVLTFADRNSPTGASYQVTIVVSSTSITVDVV